MLFYKKIIILLIISLFLGACSTENNQQIIKNKQASVIINNIHIPVEVVDTPKTRQLGLSYRKSLAKDTGMLFDMQRRREETFWMKDMNFPLDIIWIDKDQIINISKNLPPAGSHPDITYSSQYPVTYVLEVNGGFCQKKGIKIGDKVKINLEKNKLK